jgi:hypothetical protein
MSIDAGICGMLPHRHLPGFLDCGRPVNGDPRESGHLCRREWAGRTVF